jgi:molybdate transport system substrate-binding protein
VLAVPAENPAAIDGPFDIAQPGTKIVAAGREVPVTGYAAELLEELATLPGAPADFVARYDANVVSREDNVRAVAAKLELGEADAGIVYRTDAIASSLTVVPLPPEIAVRATYGGVVVRRSRDASAAQAFLDWLAGPDGRAILADFGFGPPP